MRDIVILFSIILILSCEKYGETLPLSGTKLVEIVHDNDGNKWSEKFSYDSSGRLIEINQIEREKYLFEYDGNRIHRIINVDWDDHKIETRDSFVYNSAGQLEKIYNFYRNSDEPEWLDEYYYNLNGEVTEKKIFSYNSSTYLWHEKYHWEDGNITRMEEFDSNEELAHEFFYTFDDKINFRSQIPYFMNNPLYWSRNNITKSDFNDYTGFYDSICKPCLTKYDYNLDDYPVKLCFAESRKMTLYYK